MIQIQLNICVLIHFENYSIIWFNAINGKGATNSEWSPLTSWIRFSILASGPLCLEPPDKSSKKNIKIVAHKITNNYHEKHHKTGHNSSVHTHKLNPRHYRNAIINIYRGYKITKLNLKTFFFFYTLFLFSYHLNV